MACKGPIFLCALKSVMESDWRSCAKVDAGEQVDCEDELDRIAKERWTRELDDDEDDETRRAETR